MSKKECIILAGGLGTRLLSVTGNLPKCMARVNGVPFINFVLAYLKSEGVDRFIFSLGYKSEMIVEHLDREFAGDEKVYVIETEPLDTGGAIKKACYAAEQKDVIVVNGDTIFNIPLDRLIGTHRAKDADCTIALKEMEDFERYSTVTFSNDGTITAFHEKEYSTHGFINGGIYILNKDFFLQQQLPEKFSFEKDYLQKETDKGKINSVVFNNYFVDIGVPEDYNAFQRKYISSSEPSKPGAGGILELIGAFLELLG